MEKHQHSLLSAALCFNKVKFSSTDRGRLLQYAECMMKNAAAEEGQRGRGAGGEGGRGAEGEARRVSLQPHLSPRRRGHAQGRPAGGAPAPHSCSHDEAVAQLLPDLVRHLSGLQFHDKITKHPAPR